MNRDEALRDLGALADAAQKWADTIIHVRAGSIARTPGSTFAEDADTYKANLTEAANGLIAHLFAAEDVWAVFDENLSCDDAPLIGICATPALADKLIDRLRRRSQRGPYRVDRWAIITRVDEL